MSPCQIILTHLLIHCPFPDYGVHKGGKYLAKTPFQEDAPRHKGLNFYYVQEDMLKEAAKKSGYHWIVSRPNFIIGQSKVSGNGETPPSTNR